MQEPFDFQKWIASIHTQTLDTIRFKKTGSTVIFIAGILLGGLVF